MSMSSSKRQLIKIQKREPLGQWEFAEMDEMTFDDAIARATRYLSPDVMPSGRGTAIEVRFGKYGIEPSIYIPQFVD